MSDYPYGMTTAVKPQMKPADPAHVVGFCPMGCGETLFLGCGGYVTCSFVECPNPTAVSDLLEDNITAHVVEFGPATAWSSARDFTIRHPLRERLDNQLMTCDLHRFCSELPGPVVRPGRYLAHQTEVAGWWFTEFDE